MAYHGCLDPEKRGYRMQLIRSSTMNLGACWGDHTSRRALVQPWRASRCACYTCRCICPVLTARSTYSPQRPSSIHARTRCIRRVWCRKASWMSRPHDFCSLPASNRRCSLCAKCCLQPCVLDGLPSHCRHSHATTPRSGLMAYQLTQRRLPTVVTLVVHHGATGGKCATVLSHAHWNAAAAGHQCCRAYHVRSVHSLLHLQLHLRMPPITGSGCSPAIGGPGRAPAGWPWACTCPQLPLDEYLRQISQLCSSHCHLLVDLRRAVVDVYGMHAVRLLGTHALYEASSFSAPASHHHWWHQIKGSFENGMLQLWGHLNTQFSLTMQPQLEGKPRASQQEPTSEEQPLAATAHMHCSMLTSVCSHPCGSPTMPAAADCAGHGVSMQGTHLRLLLPGLRPMACMHQACCAAAYAQAALPML
jgi:hypothetical protein